MKKYERILESLFAKDCQFALATSHNNIPSVRIVDLYYCDGAFYLVSYKNSQKLMEIEANKTVALCQDMVRFKGQAYNIGHPLDETNKEIRQELIKVFEKWYFAHNDQNMCYVKIVLDEGFFYKDGMGYRMNFKEKSCKEFPFTFDLIIE